MAAALLERWFRLRESGTTLGREIIAGLTTFAAMSYILVVNPSILAESGMDKGAVITATALASALMTAIFGIVTRFPIALAPGMGMNSFFTYTVCIQHGVPWQAALGMVFLSGVAFLALSVTGLRRQIIESIPKDLKIAISCGIGLFIAFIGLQKGGLIAAHPVTLVTAGRLGSTPALLAFGGLLLAGILEWRRVRGSILISLAVVTIAGAFLPDPNGGTITRYPTGDLLPRIFAWPASLAPTFLQLDLGWVFGRILELFPLLLALLFVDLFDNMGTLIGVTRRAGLVGPDDQIPRLGRALSADASAAMVGSVLGTSTVTSYIESAAGVEEGGRTGLTALVVSACFLLALFFHPLIQVVPGVATAPALILVGILMMQGLMDIDWKDLRSALPAGVTILVMPLTFSISEGLALGFLTWAIIALGTGGWRQLQPVGWILTVLFVVHLLTRR